MSQQSDWREKGKNCQSLSSIFEWEGKRELMIEREKEIGCMERT